MPKQKLTMALCRKAVCPDGKAQEDYRDTETTGLCLRVSKSGARKWCLLYRSGGRERRHTFADFAEKGDRRGLDLKTATARAIALRGDLIAGEEIGRVRSEGNTVADVLETHIAALTTKGRRASYIKDIQGRFNAHVLPKIGKMPIASVQQKDIAKILNPLIKDQKRRTHNVLLTIMPPLWKLAKVPCPITGNFEALPGSAESMPFELWELVKIWKTLDAPGFPAHPLTVAAIKLAALTLKRSGETSKITLSQIDFDRRQWTIPADISKGGRGEIIPLSDLALSILDSAFDCRDRPRAEPDMSAAKVAWARDPNRDHQGPSPEFLALDVVAFPSPRDYTKPIGQGAVSKALTRARKAADIESKGRSLHNLRHTGATELASRGLAPHLVSALLGHKDGTSGAAAVTARYNKYSLLNERRQALDSWANILTAAIENRPEPSNVTRLRQDKA